MSKELVGGQKGKREILIENTPLAARKGEVQKKKKGGGTTSHPRREKEKVRTSGSEAEILSRRPSKNLRIYGKP